MQFHTFCIKGLFGYTQEEDLVQNITKIYSDLKSGAPDLFFFSDSYGQVSLVDKQIS